METSYYSRARLMYTEGIRRGVMSLKMMTAKAVCYLGATFSGVWAGNDIIRFKEQQSRLKELQAQIERAEPSQLSPLQQEQNDIKNDQSRHGAKGVAIALGTTDAFALGALSLIRDKKRKTPSLQQQGAER